MDGGAWWATVPGIAKSQTRLSDFTLGNHYVQRASLMAQTVKNLSAMKETQVQFMGQEGNGNPLQYSCLENFMDRGGWQAAAKSWT